MMTARCFGNRPRFNFSSRNASSAVTAPSGWEDATWRVFEEVGSVTGVRRRSPLPHKVNTLFGEPATGYRMRFRNDNEQIGQETGWPINSRIEEYATTSVRMIAATVEIHATQLNPLGLV